MKSLTQTLTIPIILLSLLVSSCGLDCVVLDQDITFTVASDTGEDLLNPNHPNAFLEEDITYSHWIDGEFVEYFQGNLDAPKGFRMAQNQDSVYQLTLFAIATQDESEEELVTALLQWSATEADTIQYQLEEGSGCIPQTVTYVWVNGVLVWPYEGSMGRTIHLVK